MLARTLPGPAVTEVVAPLPVLLVRALDGPQLRQLVGELVSAGWRTGQLRSRIGAEPAQGSPERDAEHVLEVLRGLRAQTPPDVAHAQEVEQRQRERERQQRSGPTPASPEVRSRAVAQIRAGLRGTSARRPEPAPRPRPACCLCDGEGSYFVTREVHLCRQCVGVLATGEARLSVTG